MDIVLLISLGKIIYGTVLENQSEISAVLIDNQVDYSLTCTIHQFDS